MCFCSIQMLRSNDFLLPKKFYSQDIFSCSKIAPKRQAQDNWRLWESRSQHVYTPFKAANPRQIHQSVLFKIYFGFFSPFLNKKCNLIDFKMSKKKKIIFHAQKISKGFGIDLTGLVCLYFKPSFSEWIFWQMILRGNKNHFKARWCLL